MHTVEAYDNPKGTTTLLAYTIHQFRNAACARYDIYMSWKHCNAYLEEHGNESVQAALEQIRQHGEQLITTYAQNNKASIDQSISQTQSGLEKEQTNIATSLKALSELSQAIDPAFNNAELIMLNYALKTSCLVENNGWNILNNTQSIRGHQQEILSMTKELFFAYYKALYKNLEQCDEQYQMILFSPRGFLIKGDRPARLQP